jgi:site-specific DNA-adenine methylase
VKAPFAYYGGKTGMARRLVAMLPPHRTYIEPFFGSGAVLFAKPPATHEIINDVDHNVVTFFRVLRDRTDELVDACALTPHAREEYAAADLGEDLDEVERARRFWVRVNQSFSHAAGPRSGWSITTSLAEVLHSTPAAVLLSGYHSPLYDDLYGDWPRIEIPVLAQSSNAVTAARGERTEVIWSNRPLAAGTLFDDLAVCQ